MKGRQVSFVARRRSLVVGNKPSRRRSTVTDFLPQPVPPPRTTDPTASSRRPSAKTRRDISGGRYSASALSPSVASSVNTLSSPSSSSFAAKRSSMRELIAVSASSPSSAGSGGGGLFLDTGFDRKLSAYRLKKRSSMQSADGVLSPKAPRSGSLLLRTGSRKSNNNLGLVLTRQGSGRNSFLVLPQASGSRRGSRRPSIASANLEPNSPRGLNDKQPGVSLSRKSSMRRVPSFIGNKGAGGAKSPVISSSVAKARWKSLRKIGRVALMLKKVANVTDEARRRRLKARWRLVRKLSRAAMAIAKLRRAEVKVKTENKGGISNYSQFRRLAMKNPPERSTADIDFLASNVMKLKYFRSNSVTMMQCRELCRRFTFEEYLSPHSVVFEQGSVGDSFYILLDGVIQVLVKNRTRRGKNVVAELHSGDSFGELALSGHSEETKFRSATILTKTPCDLIRINQEAYVYFSFFPFSLFSFNFSSFYYFPFLIVPCLFFHFFSFFDLRFLCIPLDSLARENPARFQRDLNQQIQGDPGFDPRWYLPRQNRLST